MSKIYEAAWHWMGEAALFLVADGHSIEEVMDVYKCDNIGVIEPDPDGITEDDFQEYGKPVSDNDANTIGMVIDKGDLLYALYGDKWPSELINMSRE